MPFLFDRQITAQSSAPQDKGKLLELDTHQLLESPQGNQIATFDDVRNVGKWFLSQKYNTVIPSNQPLPNALLTNHELAGNAAFTGKLALGSDPESQFPVTIELITTPRGRDFRIHIVPIHFGALETSQYGSHTDSLLALAAAATVAPHFVLGLEQGLTGDCSVKENQRKSIHVDHGTPLAAIFESFQHQQGILDATVQLTGNKSITLQEAAHLHHLPKSSSKQISTKAGVSKIAAGVPIRTVLRSELPKHALFISTYTADNGLKLIVSPYDSLLSNGEYDLGLVATALGMTASVVGDEKREQKMEKVLSVKSGDIPLRDLLS